MRGWDWGQAQREWDLIVVGLKRKRDLLQSSHRRRCGTGFEMDEVNYCSRRRQSKANHCTDWVTGTGHDHHCVGLVVFEKSGSAELLGPLSLLPSVHYYYYCYWQSWRRTGARRMAEFPDSLERVHHAVLHPHSVSLVQYDEVYCKLKQIDANLAPHIVAVKERKT